MPCILSVDHVAFAPEPKTVPLTDKNEQLAKAEAAFRKYLHSRGEKYTKPRQIILSAVMEIDEHFEAEQLLVHLRQHGVRAAKATIYRTLPLLVDCGILKQVRLSDKQSHYEHTFGELPHDHMVCRRCGRIVEFSADEVTALSKRIADRQNFHIISHRFQISGLCADCLKTCPAATRIPP